MPHVPKRLFQFPWRSRKRIASDVDTELEFHLATRVTDLIAQGLHPADAARRAREEFGDVEFTRKYCREVDQRAQRQSRLVDRLAAWRQDFHYAGRTLRRSPGFAAVSLLTLALAIGANTAIFSVAHRVLLKPLPYGDPGALVRVYSQPVDDPARKYDLSAPDLVDYRTRMHSLTDIAAYWAGYSSQLATWRVGDGDAETVIAMPVTSNLFSLLQVRPWRGRTFDPAEEAAAAPVVVLSHKFWQRAFQDDSTIVGRTITLSNQSYQVIGIMPRGFTVAGDEGVWIPFNLSDELTNASVTRKQHVVSSFARLKPGVSLAAARTDLLANARRLQTEYPEADGQYLATLDPLHDTVSGRVQKPILLLFVAAIVVLLIACANLANITLARMTSRRTEIAVRAALGAGRGRLARQLLTESVLLAMIGGMLGVGLAMVATRALLALNPNSLPPRFEMGMDGRVLLFSLALSIGTGLLFGLVPALGAARTDLQASLKARGSGGRGGERVRRALVVAQMGLAVVLLVSAGLLIRSFHSLTTLDLGFDPDHVLTTQTMVDGPRYDSAGTVNAFYDGMLAEIGGAPGVEAAGAVMSIPTQGGTMSSAIVVEGSVADPNQPASIGYSMVRGDYFKAMGIPLLAGRAFGPADDPQGPPAAILNATAAGKFFPRGDAVGRRVRIGPNPEAPWHTIVGVVGDVRNQGFEYPVEPQLYNNGRQQTWWRTLSLVVRTSGDPSSAVPIVRQAVKAADPGIAVRDFETLEQVVASSLAPRRFALGLASSFAGLALLLSAVGVYGVLAYSVTARTREFGVRLALGASSRNILGLVLRQGLVWSLVGLALGVVAALAAGRLLTGMLFGVTTADAPTYLAVAGSLLVVVVIACILPAMRAARVDPLTNIRSE
jgi:putative ABC transport system permease protein